MGTPAPRPGTTIDYDPRALVDNCAKPSMILTLVVEAFQIMLNQNQAHYFPRSVVGRLSSPIGSSSGRGIGLTVSFMVGWLMLAAGACIRATCYHHLGRFFTFELALRENHQLVTTGPYAVVRHPAYTGSVLALVGMAVMQLGPGSWWADVAGMWSTPAGVVLGCAWLGLLSIIPVGIVARTAAEDKVLHKEFGQQWEAWAQNTPYRLVPGIF